MRDFIIIIFILILVACGSFFTLKYYENIKEVFSNKLEIMLEDLKSNKFDIEKINDIEKIWLSKESTLIVFQSHDLVGKIEEDLYECFHYYKKGELDDFELTKQKVIDGLDDLIKRERLSIVNIF